MLELSPDFKVVPMLDIAEICAQSCIEQVPILCERSWQVRKRIRAGEVMVAVLPHECVYCQRRGCAEQVCPGGSNVKRVDECSLVLPRGRLIELVWLLEPGARIVEVQVEIVVSARLKIHAVKDVLRVSLGMNNCEFGWVEEAAGLKASGAYEIPPMLAAGGEIEIRAARPERPIGSTDVARRLQVQT